MTCDKCEPIDCDCEVELCPLHSAAEAMLQALKALVQRNEKWNAAVASVTGRPEGWNDSYLDAARAAISSAEQKEKS